MSTYNLAISFAGEQRTLARDIARQLNPLGYRVFYDAYHVDETFSADLPELLHQIYTQTNCIAVLVSQAYVSNPYTNFERQAIMQNYIYNPNCKILPVIVEDAVVPGFPNTIGSVRFDGDLNMLCSHIASVLGERPPMQFFAGIDDVRAIMGFCFRRAIFTSMKEEISSEKMFGSIEACIGQLNSYLPRIIDPELSQFVNSLVLDMNEIDRYSVNPATFSIFFSENDKSKIDSLKISIIDKLHYLNNRFDAWIDMPMEIGLGYPFERDYRNYDFVDQ
jgi:TIR domain